MSTNYFNVPTYRTTTQFQPPAININMPEMPSLPAGLDASVMGNAAAPNYAARNMYLGQLGSGGSIATRYKGLMQARRDAAKAQTRGYGGINWRDDDPNTVADESLTPTYESDKMGQNERDAYNAALSRGAASGVSYSTAGDQFVGAALQRVSDEAAKTVSQYAGDINAYATQQLNESSTALSNYMSLYGADAEWALKQNVDTTPKPDPQTARPDAVAASGQANSPTNPFIAGQGKTVWSGGAAPSAKGLKAIRDKYPASKGYSVTSVKVGKNKWVVRVQYMYDPANPASPPINAGYLDRRMG